MVWFGWFGLFGFVWLVLFCRFDLAGLGWFGLVLFGLIGLFWSHWFGRYGLVHINIAKGTTDPRVSALIIVIAFTKVLQVIFQVYKNSAL